ncbi:MAG: hypothetical protein QOF48_3450, partial [Verrucomicrobiota bacterium]
NASGQGWVYFANHVNGALDAPVSGCSGLLSGTGFTAQLFGGPAGTTDSSLAALTPQAPFNSAPATPGIVKGPAAGVVVPGVPAGQVARIQLRVWDNRGGTITSWAAAVANPTISSGASPSFDSPPLTPQNTAEPVILTGLQSFTICPLRLSIPSALGNGVYSIQALGTAGQQYEIETSSTLTNWVSLFPVTNVSGVVQFRVTNAPPLKARFYRARIGP